MENRLCNSTLKNIDNRIQIPRYDRDALQPDFVHIGLGHFHRAHYLTYLEKLLNKGISRSGVFEVDIVPVNELFINHLRQQDFLYSLQTKATDGTETLAINGGIIGYANATTEPQKVLDLLTSPSTQVISLTITEKGYYYNDTGLNWDAKPIIDDLKSERWPHTAVGFLAKALKVRFDRGKIPVTLLSCDNIPVNGIVLKTCLLEFIEKKYPEIISWVQNGISFPCTMVDRITPGTSSENIREIAEKYHLIDNCAVHSEDFIQWVIEDSGSEMIRKFSQAGAAVVENVKPYELMKIRLLNGSHSALSYPAYLMGFRKVDVAITDPLIHSFIRNHYMEEISASLSPVSGIDLEEYKNHLVNRFANKNIADTILRLTCDGSKRISNAIVRPLLELRESGKYHAMVLALAFWARFLEGTNEQGERIPIDDPLRDILVATQGNYEAFLKLNGICDDRILHLFTNYRREISKSGTRETMKKFLEGML